MNDLINMIFLIIIIILIFIFCKDLQYNKIIDLIKNTKF